MTSLAKSLAKSGVTKQENPDNETPASYMFMLHRSCNDKKACVRQIIVLTDKILQIKRNLVLIDCACFSP